MRPTMSLAAPAANGTIAWMFRSGQFCASSAARRAGQQGDAREYIGHCAKLAERRMMAWVRYPPGVLREVLAGRALAASIGGAASAVQRRDGRSAGDWIGWRPRFSLAAGGPLRRSSQHMPSFSHLVPRSAARAWRRRGCAPDGGWRWSSDCRAGRRCWRSNRGPQLARTLAAAKSWGYQLQDVDPEVIAASPYDMVVIDYSRDGTSETVFTPAELETMKKKPDGGRRIVLVLSVDRRGREIPLLLEMVLGLVFRLVRAVVARPAEQGMARQLCGALLGPGLAGHHRQPARTAISTASSRRDSTASGSTRSTSSNSTRRSRTRRR